MVFSHMSDIGLSFTFNNIVPISLYGLRLSGFDPLLVKTFNNSVIDEKDVFIALMFSYNLDGFFTYE